MSYSDSKFGRIGAQGAVHVQTCQDLGDISRRMKASSEKHLIYPGAPATDRSSVVGINAGDLVFRVTSGRSSHAIDGGLQVTSNCNGLYVPRSALPKKNFTNKESLTYQALSESIHFVGQALGSTNPNPDRAEETKTQVTTKVQGTAHVINTGDENIAPGDLLVWDLFRAEEISRPEFRRRMGVQDGSEIKVPLKVVPMSYAQRNLCTNLRDAFETKYKSKTDVPSPVLDSAAEHVYNFIFDCLKKAYADGTPDKEIRESPALENIITMLSGQNSPLDALVTAVQTLQTDVERRTFGRALSFAKPGKPVDALLRF